MKITIRKEPKQSSKRWPYMHHLRNTGANTRTIIALSVVLLAACDVKDPIHNTSHPDHGTVILTADWSHIGEGLGAPASYAVQAGDFSTMLNGVTNRLDYLFNPGDHRIYVYNTTENLTVNGSTATVSAIPAAAGQTGTFIHSTPGWLFTCVAGATIEKDREYAITAVMQQQIRQLTLVITPTGAMPERIEDITGSLSGVAGSLNFDNGTHSAPSAVPLTFTRITQGTDAGKWAATVRLLGITGTEQRLTGTITFTGNNPAPINLNSDLSAALAGFNDQKHIPLTLGGATVNTATEPGFGSTISEWIPGGTIDSDAVVM